MPNPAAGAWILRPEYAPGNKVGAQGVGLGTTNINKVNVSASSVMTDTLTYPGDVDKSFKVNTIGFNSVGTKFATGNSDGTINIWGHEPSNDTYTPREKLYGHSGPVIDISLGSYWAIVSLSSSGEIFEWEYDFIADRYNLAQYFPIQTATVVRFCPDLDPFFLVGLQDGKISKFDFSSVTNTYEHSSDI